MVNESKRPGLKGRGVQKLDKICPYPAFAPPPQMESHEQACAERI